MCGHDKCLKIERQNIDILKKLRLSQNMEQLKRSPSFPLVVHSKLVSTPLRNSSARRDLPYSCFVATSSRIVHFAQHSQNSPGPPRMTGKRAWSRERPAKTGRVGTGGGERTNTIDTFACAHASEVERRSARNRSDSRDMDPSPHSGGTEGWFQVRQKLT